LKSDTKNKIKYEYSSSTVIGASHLRNGIPNQDSIDVYCGEQDEEPFKIFALSDGHGSDKYFRSDTGSKIAVEKAIEVLKAFFKEVNYFKDIDPLEIEIDIIDKIPRRIEDEWKKTVLDHLKTYPFTEDELNKLYKKEGEKSLDFIKRKPGHAYGATLLAAAVIKNYILLFQLGDGDILFLDKKKRVFCPLKSDERLIGNDTTSLCMRDAFKDFRSRIIRLTSSEIPELILMSTDGYSKSYTSEDDFFKVARDIADFIHKDGIKIIQDNLSTWLDTTSKYGCGDDVSACIILPTEIMDDEKIIYVGPQKVEGCQTYNTIREAIKNAKPNQKIFVTQGNYKESIVIDKPLELFSYPGNRYSELENDNFNCITINSEGVFIKNFYIKCTSGLGYSIEINNCSPEIEDCVIYSAANIGIYVKGNNSKPKIIKSVIHNCKIGVYFDEGSGGNILKCLIFRSETAAILIWKAMPKLDNCQITDSQLNGIMIYDKDKIYHDRKLFQNVVLQDIEVENVFNTTKIGGKN